MPTIYISDSGDDKNDGLSLKTPIYSLKQAQKLQAGKNDYSWHFGPRAGSASKRNSPTTRSDMRKGAGRSRRPRNTRPYPGVE
jgi:hypothetical protein